ncbi:MAG: hypothetical protein IKL09_03605, partial [Clostridia bacterium]|nr:hypothetical protein [Clostridia bacterium]
MKRFLPFLLALAMVFCAAFLSSCGEETPNVNKDEPKKNNTAALGAIDDLAEFTIVRSDKATEEVKNVAVSLRKTLNEKFGVDIKLGTDYSGTKPKEILIGETKRAESKKAMEDITSYSEYLIRRVGDKIVICAGSDEALMNATELWTTKMVNKSGKLCIPGDEKGYIYSPETKKLDLLTIEGNPISDYYIVYESDVFADAATQISNVIFDIADIKLEVVNVKSTIPKDAHVIKIGEPGSEVKKSSFVVNNGYIEITPSYYDADWSADYVEMLLSGAIDRKLDITSYHNTDAVYELEEIYSKEDVMTVLEKVYNSDQIIVGTEMANGANHVSKTLLNYYEKSGQYPGILGLDVRYANLHKLG